MNKLPKARTENLVEQNLKQETLIYDLITNQAFNLNETLSIVYKACDGVTTFAELRRQYKFTDDFIFLALDELKQNDLLAKDAAYHSPFTKTSRREAIKKVGLASVFVLPLIAGLVAPKAIHAASNEAAARIAAGGSCQASGSVCVNEAVISGTPFTISCLKNTTCCYSRASYVSGESYLPDSNYFDTFYDYPGLDGTETNYGAADLTCCLTTATVTRTVTCEELIEGEDANGPITVCRYKTKIVNTCD